MPEAEETEPPDSTTETEPTAERDAAAEPDAIAAGLGVVGEAIEEAVPPPETEDIETEDIKELVTELSASLARLRDAGARIASEAQALERGGDEIGQTMEAFGEAARSGGDRLDASEEHGDEALGRWTEATEAAASALGEAERLQHETGAAFDAEMEEASRELQERLSELGGAFSALETALEGLGADVDALADGLDDSASRLEQVVTATGEAADAASQDLAAKTDQVIEVVSGELGPILDQGFDGLVAEVDAQLAPATNPLATVEKETEAVLTSVTEELSAIGDEAIDAVVEVVREVAPEWERPQSTATAAVDETVDEQGVPLFEELDRLLGALHSGIGITGAWADVLPQLPPLPEKAAWIQSQLDAAEAEGPEG